MNGRLHLASLLACIAAAVALAPAASAGDPILDGSDFDALDGAITLYAPSLFQVSLLAKSTTARAQVTVRDDVCAAIGTLDALEHETEALAGINGFGIESAAVIAARAENVVADLRDTHPPSPCIPPGPPQIPPGLPDLSG